MAFSSSDNNKKLFTEINITPLTDIFLVLLIIMMVIAPSFQSVDTNINIPEINSGISIEQKNAEISVTKTGQFYINGKPISSNSLVKELNELKPYIEKPEVVVKADSQTKNTEILKIMKAAQEAEYTKLVVDGVPLTKKEQRNLEKNAAVKNDITKNDITKNKSQVSGQDYNWDE